MARHFIVQLNLYILYGKVFPNFFIIATHL